jgi:hypothetical protein
MIASHLLVRFHHKFYRSVVPANVHENCVSELHQALYLALLHVDQRDEDKT